MVGLTERPAGFPAGKEVASVNQKVIDILQLRVSENNAGRPPKQRFLPQTAKGCETDPNSSRVLYYKLLWLTNDSPD